MGISKMNVLRRMKPRKEKETRNSLAHVITMVRQGKSRQTSGNMKPIKIRGQQIGRRKKTQKEKFQMLRSCWNAWKLMQSNLKLTRFSKWELVLKKLDKILVPSNPPNYNWNDVGNTYNKEIKKDGLACKNHSCGTEYHLNKMGKLSVPAKVALLQHANICFGDSGASVICMNDRT